MRVISGKYKRGTIKGFEIEGTRPTMDRVKESMFAMVQSYIKESVVLDLFSGTGALGIEALSNGANKCYFVDLNNTAIKTINANIKTLNISEETIIIKNDFKTALKDFKDKGIKFSLIILDPPYGRDLVNESLDLISKYDLLESEGIIVCELENEKIKQVLFETVKQKRIKNKEIIVLK